MIQQTKLAVAILLATGLLLVLWTGAGQGVQAHGGVPHASEAEAASHQANEPALQSCKQRSTIIKGIMKRMANRAQKHLELFDTTSDRTQQFYHTQRKTSDYFEHKANETMARRQAAMHLVGSLTAKSGAFSCGASDPRQMIEDFLTEHRKTSAALGAYKAAVKELMTEAKTTHGRQE